jgi:hypothetical protein
MSWPSLPLTHGHSWQRLTRGHLGTFIHGSQPSSRTASGLIAASCLRLSVGGGRQGLSSAAGHGSPPHSAWQPAHVALPPGILFVASYLFGNLITPARVHAGGHNCNLNASTVSDVFAVTGVCPSAAWQAAANPNCPPAPTLTFIATDCKWSGPCWRQVIVQRQGHGTVSADRTMLSG